MKLFIQFQFWIGVLVFVIRLIEMAVVDWPQERKPKALGVQVSETIIGLAILVWAGILLFDL